MSGGVWETVETNARKVGIGETRGRRKKGGSGKKKEGEEEEEKTKKGENHGSKEGSGGMGNME